MIEYIKVGVLVNTHGLRGELKLKPMTDFPEQRFQKKATLYVSYQNEMIPVIIKNARTHKEMVLVTFDGYEDINVVEQWKGCSVSISKEQIHELADDEAYFFELKNCIVKDEQGNILGNVVEVLDTPAHAILRVKGEDTTFLVPYVKAFIQAFHKDAKTIIIHKMEGLL